MRGVALLSRLSGSGPRARPNPFFCSRCEARSAACFRASLHALPAPMTTKRSASLALAAWVTGSMLLGSTASIHAGGQFAVADDGSATYGYPIGVPPGIAGMAPKLLLSYSGNGINGPV